MTRRASGAQARPASGRTQKKERTRGEQTSQHQPHYVDKLKGGSQGQFLEHETRRRDKSSLFAVVHLANGKSHSEDQRKQKQPRETQVGRLGVDEATKREVKIEAVKKSVPGGFVARLVSTGVKGFGLSFREQPPFDFINGFKDSGRKPPFAKVRTNHVGDNTPGRCVRNHAFQAVTHLQSHATIAGADNEEQAIVLVARTGLPGFGDAKSKAFDRFAIGVRHDQNHHLGPGGLLKGDQVLLHLLLVFA